MSVDVQSAARKAIKQFTSRTTVLVVAANNLVDGVGSGILFTTERGTPFLLTARHLLERRDGWRPLRLMVPGLGGQEFFDAGEASAYGPARSGQRNNEEPLDVAVVTLRRELHASFRPLAVGLEAVPGDDATESKDVVVLTGFPTYLSFKDPRATATYQLSTLTYFTGVNGRDSNGRLEVDWQKAVPDDDVPTYPHLEMTPGQPMTLGSPVGVSGGAVWRIRGAPAGSLWSPSSDAKLIGIPVAWNERTTEYAESVVLWGPWLREVARRIDSRDPL